MQETTTTPTNDDIEAVIQMATQAAQNDPRTLPLRDTRTQLFVANLPYRVRWQDLKDLFRRAGTVLRADVSLGPDNRSRGYGTVLLATAEDAGRAVDMFSGYSWQGRILEVRADRVRDFDQPFPEAEEEYAPIGRNLFVGNLPFHVQWQDLKDLFRQAGTIVRADVALGPDGRSRGFGTVVFATEKDAHRAVGMFSGYEYNGRTLKVHYDKFSHGTQQPFDLALLSSPSTSFDLALGPEYPGDMFAMPHPLQSRLFDFPASSMHQQSPTPQASIAQLQSQLQQLQLEAHSSPIPSQSLSQSQQPLPQLEPRPPEPLSLTPPGANSNAGDTSYAGAATSGAHAQANANASAKRSPTSPHPHHPGPIALPPPPALSRPPSDEAAPGYPPVNPAFHPPPYALTPLGLPPITPSMPPFSFLPMPSPSAHPHQQHHQQLQQLQHQHHLQQQQQPNSYFGIGMGPATPTHAHFLNMTPLATPTSPHFPAYMLTSSPHPLGGGGALPSPGLGHGGLAAALSPGAFWGRAGEGTVYGAPVGQPPHPHPHPHPHSPYMQYTPGAGGGGGGSPGFFGMHAAMGMGMVPVDEPKGYFDFPLALGTGGAGAGMNGSGNGDGEAGVEREIMKGEKERERDKEKEDRERERENDKERREVDGDADAAPPAKAPHVTAPPSGESSPTATEPGAARARRHSSDAPPPSPMREGKRGPPPPLRLPFTAGSG